MKVETARRLLGRVTTLPGDKSISHRAGLIAALARGRTRVRNYSTSADCASTLACLGALGVGVGRDGASVVIDGAGGAAHGLRAPDAPLDCGNSGSTMRMLAGLLAGQQFASVLTGDESLCSRPMRRIIEPLELMGARVSSHDGRAPLRVEGRAPLWPVEYVLPVASAQVKSCVLLAGLLAEGRTRVVEANYPTRDHTERMLLWFGADVRSEQAGRYGADDPSVVSVVGRASFGARDLDVPGDVSSAAFLVAAAALLPGSDVVVEGVGLNPTRTRFLSVLQDLGADVTCEGVEERCNEPVGDVRVRGAGRLARTAGSWGENVLRGRDTAQLIDELPVLAVVGTQVEGGLEIRDARELRVKESDRIGATVEGLRALGAEVEEFEDGLRVGGPARLRGARVRSRGDHRIAMAFAVAALLAEGETEIEGAGDCVAVSFPEFFRVLDSLTER